MDLGFQLPSKGLAPFPSPQRVDLRRPRSFRVLRVLWLTTVMTLIWATTVSPRLLAQRNENEARTIVRALAGTLFTFAWPTAEYDTLSFGHLHQVDHGFSVPIVLHGISAFSGGPLWVELVVELRNGEVTDIRVGNNNAIIAPPFSAVSDMLSLYPALRDRRNAELLVGTWSDEKSVYTYTADRRIMRGPNADGVWTVQNGTLSQKYVNGHETRLTLETVTANEYRARSPGTGTRWTARRVHLSKADSIRLAGTYELSARAFLALADLDSALTYFGAAESLRNPERLAEVERLLQSSPLSLVYSTAAERQAYDQRARSILTGVVPGDALLSIPSASSEEVEDALEIMLPPRRVNVVVTSTPTGLAVRYRVTRANPRYRPSAYSVITTDTTIVHERARLQFCYLDSAGQSRMFKIPCLNGCTVRLPIPHEWTRPCEDR